MVQAGAVEASLYKNRGFHDYYSSAPIKREMANDQVSLHTCTRAKSGCGKL